ncbi:MAG: UDP-N-acetylmuramoyl-tripeptide--D-alanyl-D-alanine ligase [Clostridia bacterium]|nr:UDP-N-acetylmuramoyl-tripeptide--D-alanyl-D-alanine ligase [Clostridia bacterium]
MTDLVVRICAGVVCAVLFCLMTVKTVGAMQQGGYKNRLFLRWFRRGDNLYFNRLCVLSLCLALTTTVTALGFSFLGVKWARAISALPFLGFLVVFVFVDLRYALKVPMHRTGRFCRLFIFYLLFVIAVTCGVIELLQWLIDLNGSTLYALVGFAPFAFLPTALPFLLCAVNGVVRVFENKRNAKFVKRAGQVLNETQIIRVGIVGSYGKTSVKNILKAVLSEKYAVTGTPESYNTPIGIAKTVFDKDFAGKQVFIAEMGARKKGDISELCALVKPDYAVFTGVCEQHISSFSSLDNIFAEKSEILKCGARVVCGESLKERVLQALGEDAEGVSFADSSAVLNLRVSATETTFTLRLGEETVEVKTALLGLAAVENILLSATLAYQMGLTAEEIARGLAKMQPVPHRLQLLENNGVYILDDGYNANPRSATEALAALSRFAGRKCIVTPGIVECGVLEEKINGELGRKIASECLDLVILVGDTLVGAVKKGYLEAGGDLGKLKIAREIEESKEILSSWLRKGDAVLFLNDLPDVY